MKEQILAKRYAEGFIAAARDAVGLKAIVREFKALKNIIREHPEFESLLESMEVTYSEKCAFIEKTLDGNFSLEMRDFLKLLLEKRRFNLIVFIADYVRVTYAHGAAQDAVLRTSYPLDTEIIQAIKNKLETKLGKKLNLYVNLDASLLGGIQVTVGNTIIDGSVRKRLQELRERLQTVKVN